MKNEFVQALQRALQPLKTRVLLMVGRAIIAAVDDSKSIQIMQMQALNGESFDGVPRMGEFGFASNPPKDSDAIIVNVGSSRESMVIIATEHKLFRFKNLASGAACVYSQDGTKIHLLNDGNIEIETATKVKITSPDVEITGNLKVGGTTHGVGVATYDNKLNVADDISGAKLVKAAVAVQTLLVQSGGYSGPAGGAPGVVTTEPITTTSTVTASNVIGGGTSLSILKVAHNTHTHPENGSGGGTTSPTGTTA